MKLHLSGKQTAAIIPLGALLSAAGYLPISFVRHHSIAMLILPLGLLIGGFLISWRANESLQAGIRQQLWPVAEIDQIRSFARSRTLNWLHVAMLAPMAAFLALSMQSRRWTPWFLCCFLIAQTFFMFRNGFREAAAPSTHQPMWANAAPINSNLWGGRLPKPDKSS